MVKIWLSLPSGQTTNGFKETMRQCSYMSQLPLKFDFYTGYDIFKERMQSISSKRDAALFALAYGGCARVGEIVKGKYCHNPPVSTKQLESTDNHLIVSILTEKTHQWRRVPISVEKEQWLIEIIDNYLVLRGNLLGTSDFQIFPYTTFWAEKRFEKWFGTQRFHLLRHWATTHTLQGHRTKEKLQAYHIARLGGWTDLTTFYKTYSHFAAEDFLDMV